MSEIFEYEWEIDLEEEQFKDGESSLIDLWRSVPNDVKTSLLRIMVTFGPIYYQRAKSYLLRAMQRGISPRYAFRQVARLYPAVSRPSGSGKLTTTQVKQYRLRKLRRLPSNWRRRRYRQKRF